MDNEKSKNMELLSNERLCSKDNPYTTLRNETESGDMWIHPDSHEVGVQKDGWPHGDIITLKCPNCNVQWDEELPQ